MENITGITKAKAGRPTGSIARVTLRADDHLKLEHFAYLRALIEGIDHRKAADLYLFDAPTDERQLKTLESALLDRVMLGIEGLSDVARAAQAKAAIQTKMPEVADAPMLSIDDLADKYGDFHSERELQELFAAEYPKLDHNKRARVVATKLEAITWLQNQLARTPRADDPTTLWVPEKLANLLRPHGILTLANCVTFMNARGKHWYRNIRGLGVDRAAKLESWLHSHARYTGSSIHRLSNSSASAVAQDHVANVLVFDVVPLNKLAVPGHLDGSVGLYRSNELNTLGVNTDIEAIRVWFKTLSVRSEHTLAAYSRDVERFYLWALLEAGKPLSSLTSSDGVKFRDFVQDPPAHWICAMPYPRSHSQWRPFRGTLSARSAARTLVSVGALMRFLVESRYLAANPMASATSVGAMPKINVNRALSKRDLAAVSAYMAAKHLHISRMPAFRRERALILLWLTTGLRVSEIAAANWSDVVTIRHADDERAARGLRVIGKRKRERTVPMRQDVLDALDAHWADRDIAIMQGDLPFDDDKQAAPLISALEVPRVAHSRQANKGSLAEGTIRDLVKRFFKSVSVFAQREGLSVDADFDALTSHWLRHTFGHNVLKASGNDLAVVQALLGHTSLATTGVYLAADQTDQITAVDGLVVP